VVEPAELDRVRDLIRTDFGHEARFTHFPIGGLCPGCARAGEGEPRGGREAGPG
jgi:Fur family ferric uptake transcriptional regulator